VRYVLERRPLAFVTLLEVLTDALDKAEAMPADFQRWEFEARARAILPASARDLGIQWEPDADADPDAWARCAAYRAAAFARMRTPPPAFVLAPPALERAGPISRQAYATAWVAAYTKTATWSPKT
jgi:hypothetical protein